MVTSRRQDPTARAKQNKTKRAKEREKEENKRNRNTQANNNKRTSETKTGQPTEKGKKYVHFIRSLSRKQIKHNEVSD